MNGGLSHFNTKIASENETRCALDKLNKETARHAHSPRKEVMTKSGPNKQLTQSQIQFQVYLFCQYPLPLTNELLIDGARLALHNHDCNMEFSIHLGLNSNGLLYVATPRPSLVQHAANRLFRLLRLESHRHRTVVRFSVEVRALENKGGANVVLALLPQEA